MFIRIDSETFNNPEVSICDKDEPVKTIQIYCKRLYMQLR